MTGVSKLAMGTHEITVPSRWFYSHPRSKKPGKVLELLRASQESLSDHPGLTQLTLPMNIKFTEGRLLFGRKVLARVIFDEETAAEDSTTQTQCFLWNLDEIETIND